MGIVLRRAGSGDSDDRLQYTLQLALEFGGLSYIDDN